MQNTNNNNNNRCGFFVRGYFAKLDEIGVAAAALHDWQDGFENELTDVDYVIDPDDFPKVSRLVADYCEKVGWRLCQVLRHETSAAFCVCSAADDPSCTVALDACSDYRRNGTLLLRASELLAYREPLPWGGWRLSETSELKYRLIKAAAKQKSAVVIGPELANYPLLARESCEQWLQSRWNLYLPDWSNSSLAKLFSDLHRKTCSRYGGLTALSVLRVAGRITKPTGLLVTFKTNTGPELPETVKQTFGRLYFRRVRFLPQGGGGGDLLSIIRSTIIITPRAGWLGMLLPRSWRMRINSSAPHTAQQELAGFLQQRCHRREGIRPTIATVQSSK
jgi:hypothetical protein